MQTLLIAIIAAFGFIVAYHTYGKWLGKKIFQLSADAICPSIELQDDVDFVPTNVPEPSTKSHLFIFSEAQQS